MDGSFTAGASIARRVFYDDFSQDVAVGLGTSWYIDYSVEGQSNPSDLSVTGGVAYGTRTTNMYESWGGFPFPDSGFLYFEYQVLGGQFNDIGVIGPGINVYLYGNETNGWYVETNSDSGWSDTPSIVSAVGDWLAVKAAWTSDGWVALKLWTLGTAEPDWSVLVPNRRGVTWSARPALDLYIYDDFNLDNFAIYSTQPWPLLVTGATISVPLFWDTFTRTTSAGDIGTPDSGQAYTIQGGSGYFVNGSALELPGNGYLNSAVQNVARVSGVWQFDCELLGSTSWQQIDTEIDVGSTYFYGYLRYSGSYVSYNVNSGETDWVSITTPTWYRFKFGYATDSATVSFKWWDRSTTEPVDWAFSSSIYDTSFTGSNITFNIQAGATFHVDNFYVYGTANPRITSSFTANAWVKRVDIIGQSKALMPSFAAYVSVYGQINYTIGLSSPQGWYFYDAGISNYRYSRRGDLIIVTVSKRLTVSGTLVPSLSVYCTNGAYQLLGYYLVGAGFANPLVTAIWARPYDPPATYEGTSVFHIDPDRSEITQPPMTLISEVWSGAGSLNWYLTTPQWMTRAASGIGYIDSDIYNARDIDMAHLSYALNTNSTFGTQANFTKIVEVLQSNGTVGDSEMTGYASVPVAGQQVSYRATVSPSAGTYGQSAIFGILAATDGFSADAYFSQPGYKVFTANATIAGRRISVTADAVIKLNALNGARTTHHRKDSHFGTTPATAIVLSSPVGTSAAGTTLEAYLGALNTLISSYEQHAYGFGYFLAKAITKTHVTGSLTADALAAATLSGSFVADGITWRTQLGSFTGSAIAQWTVSASFAEAAVLLRSWLVETLADAIVQSTASGSFTGSAVALFPQSASLTGDAWFLGDGSVTGSFTANSAFFTTLTGSLTGDAMTRVIVSSTATFDSFFMKVQSFSFTEDAVTKKNLSGSATADAVIGSTGSTDFQSDTFQSDTFQ